MKLKKYSFIRLKKNEIKEYKKRKAFKLKIYEELSQKTFGVIYILIGNLPLN